MTTNCAGSGALRLTRTLSHRAITSGNAGDAEASFAYLRGRADIDARRIGLIGHREGGIIAPMIAATNHDVDFIVMLAGSGVPGDEVIVSQVELLSEAAASDPAHITQPVLVRLRRDSISSSSSAQVRLRTCICA